MDFQGALGFLDRHVNLEATAGRVHGLSLDVMRGLVACMGDPQQDVRTIHVTGTNGKGSVAAMAASLLDALGLRVGVYSSPHVDTIRERLAIGGTIIEEEEFANLIGDLARYAEAASETPSYFELMTAAALLWFANEAVDVAVVEVGLLGRFDATNVVESDVAVVTNIGRDHTDGQGDWRRAIAGEKAGIVRAGRPLVLGETAIDVRDLFLAEQPDPFFECGRDFGVTATQMAVGGQQVDLFGPHGRYDEVFVSLLGAYQADNAAVALAAVEAFVGAPLGEEVVEQGFGTVRLPGRLEVAATGPLVLLDGAHNQEAARAVAEAVPEVFFEGHATGRRIIVFGALGPREPSEMLEELAVLAPELVVTCTAPSPRSVSADRLAEMARGLGLDAEPVSAVGDAVRLAVTLADEDDMVLVTGSFYVLAPAREALEFMWDEVGEERL
ncbi:MAG: Mur ligase family protein [Acidimicrobiales bacterium]|jgi:dihydrofolate synthase/folylpolyglutamate synthase|nr:Mur ligase family protein [Acidimicrobiales bacterium]MDP6241084.1 Mur ligase family protein [Acidimicrobiales bacterium]MDP7352332.1 Mur ligase family protein [Acidimicrobiales bacterium]MDP7509190.1 Mur ligase family protein [Acidimicrobiales bacterium]MEE1563864.1 Mur ligase family protein [Acidimicrobiales bacterium]|tara:strand:- start:20877 stop:22202 length:1326 start_codon:yes stop_codon:yes gene_type:complete